MKNTRMTPQDVANTNAIWTLLSGMSVDVQNEIGHRLKERNKGHLVNEKKQDEHVWMNYPISADVMAMTFPYRKSLSNNYKDILEEELKNKYE